MCVSEEFQLKSSLNYIINELYDYGFLKIEHNQILKSELKNFDKNTDTIKQYDIVLVEKPFSELNIDKSRYEIFTTLYEVDSENGYKTKKYSFQELDTPNIMSVSDNGNKRSWKVRTNKENDILDNIVLDMILNRNIEFRKYLQNSSTSSQYDSEQKLQKKFNGNQ